jgi:hypothetical protein
MLLKIETQRTQQVFSPVDDYLLNWLEPFSLIAKPQGLQKVLCASTDKRSNYLRTIAMSSRSSRSAR